MGKPMAKNMLKSGASVTVNSATGSAYDEMKSAGAETASQLADLKKSDILFLSLPGDQVVQQVLFGAHGIAKHLGRGQIVVDTSTTSYSATLENSKALGELGVEFLDAPVSGMEARAIAGTLTVVCGGKEDAFYIVKPYLECIADKILYMGVAGSGQLTKLINQLLFDINCAALAEVLPLAVRLGLDPDKVGELVNSGTGRSYASEFFIRRIVNDVFSSGYPMKHAYKDLVSGVEIGAKFCIPMPVLAAAMSTYQAALLKGWGDLDKGAMIKVFEDLLNVKFRTRVMTTAMERTAN